LAGEVDHFHRPPGIREVQAESDRQREQDRDKALTETIISESPFLSIAWRPSRAEGYDAACVARDG
jgi:hypothetical protein